MIPRLRLIFFLAIGCLAPGFLPAEKVELRFLSWESLNTRVLSYKDGSSYHEISVRTQARSEPYDYNGTSPVEFYIDGKDAKGMPAKIEVGHADLPKDCRHPLLMFFEKEAVPGAQPQFDIKVVDDSVENFPFGSYYLFNFSNSAMSGQIESEKFQLQPNGSEIVRLANNTRRNIPVEFLASSPPQLWKETFWRHEPEKRLMVFIANDSDPRPPGYRLKVVEEHSGPAPSHL